MKRRWRQRREKRNIIVRGKTVLMRRTMRMKRRAAAHLAAAVAVAVAAAAAMKRRRKSASERSLEAVTRTRIWMMRMLWWTVCLKTPPLCWNLPAPHRESCCCWCSSSIWRIFTASQTGRSHHRVLAANPLWTRSAIVWTCGLFDSKIQKYSPTESAKVYDKAVNRKSKVNFNPRQTLEYLKNDVANRELSYETKRNIVKQFLDVSIFFIHLFILFGILFHDISKLLSDR